MGEEAIAHLVELYDRPATAPTAAELLTAIRPILRHHHAVLVGELTPQLIKAFREHGLSVAAAIKLSADVRDIVDHQAIKYAEKRAGELIKDFAQTTPALLQDTVVKALEERWSATRLRDELREHDAFSPVRALRIARTELGIAHRRGGQVSAKAAGGQFKHWRADAGAEELCQTNDAAGWIAVDDDFPNGDAPHVNCRCDVEYRDKLEAETAEPEEEAAA